MPDFANVRLLLPCDGADGSSTFTDYSTAARAVTANGNAQIDTAQSKFGGASLLLDGSGDFVSTTSSLADFRFSGDFTLEAWVRTTSGNKVLFDFYGSGVVGSYQLFISSSGYLQWYANDGGSAVLVADSASGSVITGSWVHVAACRSGTTLRLFADGVLVATATDSRNYNNTAVTPFAIGAQVYSRNASYDFSGHIDDIRVSDAAWYTAAFTPPASAHELGAISGAASAPIAFGSARLLGALQLNGQLSAGSVFGAARLLGEQTFGYVAGPALLRAPRLQGQQMFGTAMAGSPLRTPSQLGWHDFTAFVDTTAPLRYVCDLTTPDGTVRVPISSWQATLQTDTANYVQCVIPAVEEWVDSVSVATYFQVSRYITLLDGRVMEYPMAGAEPDAPTFDRGPYRFTTTLSGYTPALTAEDDPPGAYDRALTGIRQTSQTGTSYRIRCDIDILLRPGHRAINGETSFVVRYINYSCGDSEHSMYVGSGSDGA